ncbi:MAG: sulfite exporter TauE/SafE family protein [Bacteroidota bacterium]|jgi:sulfite exporter TauE/SafE|nr:sulfite exporter TauE/SafE family protein [Bacteroidota bacterium]
MSLFIAAISLGFLGSFHCIGMCGPIALALPVNHYMPLKKYAGITLYNAGRILTYSCLGLIFGGLGHSFFMGGFQQGVSITLGILLLTSVILPKLSLLKAFQLTFLYSAIANLKNRLSILFHKKGIHILFAIGALNGLLPCGLVYLGLAGAIATGNYLNGAEFMLYFGMGTAPIMFGTTVLGQFISMSYRNAIRKTVPVIVTLMAVLLIARGLNLGIPYLSPEFDHDSKVSCCEKPKTEHSTILCAPKKCH